MQIGTFRLSKGAILGAMLTIAIVAPAIVLGGNKTLYVDRDNKGSENGSKNHPYRSIDKALDNAKGGTEIFVSKGTYKENITIPKNVKLIGRKKDVGDVVIHGDSDKKATVTMKDDSEIDHITVKGGKHGIQVEENAEATIHDVTVKDSDRDGIHVDSGSRDKKYQVVISKANVHGNDKAGIYSGKRNIVIVNSKIRDNKSDGIDLSAGAKGWVADNDIRSNGGSGAKFVIDGTEMTFKNNTISSNKREGMEIASFGKGGYIGLKKAKIANNGRYGIAKVARNAQALKNFGSVAIDNSGANVNTIEKNGVGSISQVLKGF